MPPSFFKFGKGSSHTRDRSDRSDESQSVRSRALSAVSAGNERLSTSSMTGRNRVASINTGLANSSRSDVASTTSSQPNVTIVPPSPSVHSSAAASTDGREAATIDGLPGDSGAAALARERKTSTASRMFVEDNDRTPTVDRTPTILNSGFSLPIMKPRSRPATPTNSRPPSRPTTPSSSKSRSRAGSVAVEAPPVPVTTLNVGGSLRSKASAKSLNKLDTSKDAVGIMNNKRAMPSAEVSDTVSSPELVESPTSLDGPDAAPEEQQDTTGNTATGTLPTSAHQDSPSAQTSTSPSSPSSSPASPNDRQQQQDREKYRPWNRSNRKPTGLASAIAASGLAMVNPALAPPQHLNNGAPAARKSSVNGSASPYMNGDTSMPNSGSSVQMRAGTTNDVSPRSKASLATSNGRRRTSLSQSRNSAPSEYGDKDAQIDYYSGLDDDDSMGDSDSDDMESAESNSRAGERAMLDDDDIPVTGFAVASNKRNADFHELFPAVPEGDYLIEDYGCALQREILIQGRLYISENHICFHANIFGWITDLIVPICEIITLEKKMTAFVIPNALMIGTRQSKYTFASFLARDTTYDVIYNIWRLVRPSDAVDVDGQDTSRLVEDVASTPQINGAPLSIPGIAVRKATQCKCGTEGHPTHYDLVAMDIVLPGTPEKIYNLIFASAFIKEFLTVNQKLMDIQVSDWAPIEPGSKLLARNMSYIKPLNGSVGPKQTKCELRDELVHCDYEESVTTLTTTRTPDVPSGGVFSVKTLTCITWASAVSVRVLVTTQVEWTGRSFIKGIIERSCIDGQKTYHIDLDQAMRAYIQEHQSEFVPEGVDAAAVAAAVTTVPLAPDHAAGGLTDAEKQREHERNQRSLQWAWDTFDGAWNVASSSTKGAIALIRDSWEQSSSTTVLYFIIILLVISNIWTLARMGSREEIGRRKEMKKMEERERWVQGVVGALWDEMASTKPGAGLGAPVAIPRLGKTHGDTQEPTSLADEVTALHRTLDEVESRVQAIRGALESVQVNSAGLD